MATNNAINASQATPMPLAIGGTNGSLTASNGGIFYSTATAGAILAGTATAGLALLSGTSTTPSWSTSPPITQVNIQLVTTTGAGTYTPTTGMKYVIVEAQAGGGAGGGAAATAANNVASGAGGGGGEYITALFTASQIGASKAFSVGAGGTQGAVGDNNGNAGGNTTFNTTFIVTNGGTGGDGSAANANTGVVILGVGGAGGSGGTVATGTLIKQNIGQNGHIGLALAQNNYASGAGGIAGGGYPGPIGIYNAATNVGNNGANGSGGSGGGTNNSLTAVSGGVGGDGFIRFIEYISI